VNFRTRGWERFRKVLVFLFASLFIFSIVQRFMPKSGRLPEGMDVPKATLPYAVNAEGQMTIADFRGKGVLLNFWATWCGPCKAELPVLQALQEKYGGEHFQVVGISDEHPDRIRDFVSHARLTYPTAIDVRGVMSRAFKVRSIPFSVFVGPDGKVMSDWTGELDQDEGASRVEALIEAAKAYAPKSAQR
jgi:thiol-disulfide isomerase/thioredoxin